MSVWGALPSADAAKPSIENLEARILRLENSVANIGKVVAFLFQAAAHDTAGIERTGRELLAAIEGANG